MGERIRKARQQAGLTQENLAEQTNLSRASIARFELGDIEPKLQNLVLIAEALNVTTDYLLGLSDVVLRRKNKLTENAEKALETFVEEVLKMQGVEVEDNCSM